MCNNYRNLSEGDRAQGSQSGVYQCDDNLVPGWYRFQGAAGNRIADKCVLGEHCSAGFSGWMPGNHPTVAEGVVTRTVCYHFTVFHDCCRLRSYISVKNCGGYFVYEFKKPPAVRCPFRYCGNGHGNGSSGKPPFRTEMSRIERKFLMTSITKCPHR